MTSVFKSINDALSLKKNDPLLVGLLKLPLSLCFGLISLIIVYFTTFFKEIYHYHLFIKNKEGHKVKGWKVTKIGNMIQSEYQDECSCGRKGVCKSAFEVIEKTLIESSKIF